MNDGPDRALDVGRGAIGSGTLASDPSGLAALLRRYTHDAAIDSPLELEIECQELVELRIDIGFLHSEKLNV